MQIPILSLFDSRILLSDKKFRVFCTTQIPFSVCILMTGVHLTGQAFWAPGNKQIPFLSWFLMVKSAYLVRHSGILATCTFLFLSLSVMLDVQVLKRLSGLLVPSRFPLLSLP